jgi:hypothetical protein
MKNMISYLTNTVSFFAFSTKSFFFEFLLLAKLLLSLASFFSFAMDGKFLQVFFPLLNHLVPGQDSLMVAGLGAVIGLDNLLPKRAVLNLDLVRVDRLQTLIQDLEHAHQLSANLLGGHVLKMRTFGEVMALSLSKVGAEVNSPGAMVDTDLDK